MQIAVRGRTVRPLELPDRPPSPVRRTAGNISRAAWGERGAIDRFISQAGVWFGTLGARKKVRCQLVEGQLAADLSPPRTQLTKSVPSVRQRD
jgi:hypothetical protein